MNILLINHYAGTKKLGMEYRPWYLAKEWTRLGHKVTIVSSSYSHVRTIQPQINGIFNVINEDGITYFIIKTPSYSGNGYRRVLNIFSFVFWLFILKNRIIKEVKPDVVIASSTYPLDIFPAYRISRTANTKLVFEVHDLWPLSLIELAGFSKWHPFILLLQIAENFAYRRSNKVISMLPLTLDHMIQHGLNADKFNYVPNGFSDEDWNTREPLPESCRTFIADIRKKYKKIVCYAGSLGLANAMDYLVDAAILLAEDKIAIIIIGKGPESEKLKTRVQKLALKNVLFMDPVKKEAIPELLSQMDILYLGLKKQPLFRFGISPNKLFDYMMAAKPIVQAIEAGNDIVTEAGCGITVDAENSILIAQSIRKLSVLSESELRILGERGRGYVINNHNYKVLAKRFLDIITN